MDKEKIKSIGLVLFSGFVIPFLYDKIGYKLLDFLSDSPHMFLGYMKDRIISTSSNLAYSGNSYFFESIFFLIILYIVLWSLKITWAEYNERFSKKPKSETTTEKISLIKRYRCLKPVLIFRCAFYILISLFLSEQIIIIGAASTLADSTMQNIEIVAPYIEDIEYKELKSSFLQMNTYSDFCRISTRLNAVSYENNLELKNSSIYQYSQNESKN